MNDNTDRNNTSSRSREAKKYTSVNQATSSPFNASASVGASGTGSGGAMYGLDDEVIKTFDSSAIYVRSDRGCCHVHLNGLQCCVFNSTAKYRDLNLPDGPVRDSKSNPCTANNNNNNNNYAYYTNENNSNNPVLS